MTLKLFSNKKSYSQSVHFHLLIVFPEKHFYMGAIFSVYLTSTFSDNNIQLREHLNENNVGMLGISYKYYLHFSFTCISILK